MALTDIQWTETMGAEDDLGGVVWIHRGLLEGPPEQRQDLCNLLQHPCIEHAEMACHDVTPERKCQI